MLVLAVYVFGNVRQSMQSYVNCMLRIMTHYKCISIRMRSITLFPARNLLLKALAHFQGALLWIIKAVLWEPTCSCLVNHTVILTTQIHGVDYPMRLLNQGIEG